MAMWTQASRWWGALLLFFLGLDDILRVVPKVLTSDCMTRSELDHQLFLSGVFNYSRQPGSVGPLHRADLCHIELVGQVP